MSKILHAISEVLVPFHRCHRDLDGLMVSHCMPTGSLQPFTQRTCKSAQKSRSITHGSEYLFGAVSERGVLRIIVNAEKLEVATKR